MRRHIIWRFFCTVYLYMGAACVQSLSSDQCIIWVKPARMQSSRLQRSNATNVHVRVACFILLAERSRHQRRQTRRMSYFLDRRPQPSQKAPFIWLDDLDIQMYTTKTCVRPCVREATSYYSVQRSEYIYVYSGLETGDRNNLTKCLSRVLDNSNTCEMLHI